MDPIMELFVWVGDYGLVSMNAECIQAIMYIKLSKAPVKIIYSKNPYAVFHQDYPVFRHGYVVLSNYRDIVDYLKVYNYYVDYGLSGKQLSEAYTISNMVINNLKPVIYYCLWVDLKNYQELTSLWFANVMPAPFNYLYPCMKRQTVRYLVSSLFPRGEENDIMKNTFNSYAKECFNALSIRLGNNEFFFGNLLTSLDITVYGYLAPLVKIPFPSENIKQLISSWPELEKYVERIDNKIFPNIMFERKYLKKQQARAAERGKEDDEFAANLPMKLFMCTAAICAMIGYAVSKNLIDIERCRRYLLH